MFHTCKISCEYTDLTGINKIFHFLSINKLFSNIKLSIPRVSTNQNKVVVPKRSYCTKTQNSCLAPMMTLKIAPQIVPGVAEGAVYVIRKKGSMIKL